MILVKSGIGAKIVLVVLGLGLGVGGIAAGARYHAAHQPTVVNRRLFVGRITQIDGATLTIKTLSGPTITIHLLPRTIVRHAGKPITATDLHVGDVVLAHVARTRSGLMYAISVGQLKRAPVAQGP